MRRTKQSAATPFDDDVAGLFARLGVDDGAGYRDFSARLAESPSPPARTADATGRAAPSMPARVQEAARDLAPAPVIVPPRAAVVAIEPAREGSSRGGARTSLERLFQRLSEGGAAASEDSPLKRLRSS